MRYPGFIEGDYTAQSRIVSCTRSINLYPEIVGAESGKNRIALYGTPGIQRHCTLGDSPGRGLFAGDNRLFAAAGRSFYEVFSDANDFTDLGNILQDDEQIPYFGGTNTVVPAQIFANQPSSSNQLFIVSGRKGYLAVGDAIVAVVDASQGAFLDTYFIAQKPDTNQVYLSDPDNGLIWDPLQFATKEGAADRLVALVADHELLWLFGKQTTEIWQNTGSTGFPLQRIPGAFIEQGCIAAYSPVKLDNSIFWLSGSARGDGMVFRSNGFTPVRVSNHAVEYAIRTYADVEDAIGSSYEEQGHIFYRLDFPSGNATWVYDVATNMWHERALLENGRMNIHPGRFHAFAFGKHFVQDYRSGNIYVQSPTLYTDDGSPIRRVRQAPHITNEANWIQYRALQIDMEVGTGPASGAGSNPKMFLRWSNDGGFTWSDEKEFSAYSAGQYSARARWSRLGRARDRVFEWSTSEPIPIALVDAYLDLLPGTGQ